MDTGMLRELVCHPGRIGAGFLDPQPVVFTVATQLDVQLLSDDEISRRLANLA